MVASFPWPTADRAQGIVVDLDQNDLSAGLMPMQRVSTCSQHILGDVAEADQAENQSGNGGPEQELPLLPA